MEKHISPSGPVGTGGTMFPHKVPWVGEAQAPRTGNNLMVGDGGHCYDVEFDGMDTQSK